MNKGDWFRMPLCVVLLLSGAAGPMIELANPVERETQVIVVSPPRAWETLVSPEGHAYRVKTGDRPRVIYDRPGPQDPFEVRALWTSEAEQMTAGRTVTMAERVGPWTGIVYSRYLVLR